jgi:hypothetical protein
MHSQRHSRQYYDAYEGSEQAQQQQRVRGSGVGWQQAVVLKQLERADSGSTWQQQQLLSQQQQQQQWQQGGAAADDRWVME